jgi:hypothetical protein
MSHKFSTNELFAQYSHDSGTSLGYIFSKTKVWFENLLTKQMFLQIFSKYTGNLFL